MNFHERPLCLVDSTGMDQCDRSAGRANTKQALFLSDVTLEV